MCQIDTQSTRHRVPRLTHVPSISTSVTTDPTLSTVEQSRPLPNTHPLSVLLSNSANERSALFQTPLVFIISRRESYRKLASPSETNSLTPNPTIEAKSYSRRSVSAFFFLWQRLWKIAGSLGPFKASKDEDTRNVCQKDRPLYSALNPPRTPRRLWLRRPLRPGSFKSRACSLQPTSSNKPHHCSDQSASCSNKSDSDKPRSHSHHSASTHHSGSYKSRPRSHQSSGSVQSACSDEPRSHSYQSSSSNEPGSHQPSHISGSNEPRPH